MDIVCSDLVQHSPKYPMEASPESSKPFRTSKVKHAPLSDNEHYMQTMGELHSLQPLPRWLRGGISQEAYTASLTNEPEAF